MKQYKILALITSFIFLFGGCSNDLIYAHDMVQTQGKWLEAAGAKLQDDTYTTVSNRFSDQTEIELNPLCEQNEL